MDTVPASRSARTVLLVASDFRILILGQAVLRCKGHQVLVASDVQIANLILAQDHVLLDSVAIQADMNGCDQVQDCALKRGARAWTFRARVNDQSVLLEGLESGADWDSCATLAS